MRLLAAALLVLVLGASAAAHHSFAAYYFEDQLVRIEGVVDAFEVVAPHAWLYVLAPDAAGQVQRYAAEWSNPQRLARDNIDKDTLRKGDRVIVRGSPGRVAAELKIHLKAVERPADGWNWRGHNTPPVRNR